MDVEVDFIEVLDSGDEMEISPDAIEYIVTEVDDMSFDGFGDMLIEELSSAESAEEADDDDLDGFISMDPEIEEPSETESFSYNRQIEFLFNDGPITFDSPLYSNTTLKDLFSLARLELNDPEGDDELWFRFPPLGLEIGEDNIYTTQPTVGHLFKALSHNDRLKVEIQSRVSFYSKFKDLLTSLDLGDDTSAAPKKKVKRDSTTA